MEIFITVIILSSSLFIDAQTTIDDANFQEAINTCLSTYPADGMCVSSKYRPVNSWEVSQVTTKKRAFQNKRNFNADLSSWNVSNVEEMVSSTESFNQDISSWDVHNGRKI